MRRPSDRLVGVARIAERVVVGLGVAVEGRARAYSLNLLNRHEIVNDTIAGTAIAATW